MKVYIATSWKCPEYEPLRDRLISLGHEVYDFKGGGGFAFSKVGLEAGLPPALAEDPSIWSLADFQIVLDHPKSQRHFDEDEAALAAADVCVLLHRAGNSAHMEAGFAAGRGIPLIIVYETAYPTATPDLMYSWAHVMVPDWTQVPAILGDPIRRRKILGLT